MPSCLHWNLVAPSLQSRISMQAANPCFTQMNILLPSFNSESGIINKQWILMLKPNFLVANSSVSFSTRIRMLQELSSFVDQFFIISCSHLPSHVEPALVRAPANQKQGGRSWELRNQSNFTSQPFGSVPKLIFFWNKINIATKWAIAKKMIFRCLFHEAILKLEHSKPITCNSVCDVDLTSVWEHNPLINIPFWLLEKLVINCSLGNQNRTKNA